MPLHLEIRSLDRFALSDAEGIREGFVTDERYLVSKAEAAGATTIALTLVKLPAPFVKRWDSIAGWLIGHYQSFLGEGFSLGAYECGSDRLLGFLLGEREDWNRSVHVWEFHVRLGYQRQGIGRRLMDEAEARCRAAGYRLIVCETPNTNAPAIKAYYALGFEVGAVDLYYYGNHGADSDHPDAEVAVFMVRRL